MDQKEIAPVDFDSRIRPEFSEIWAKMPNKGNGFAEDKMDDIRKIARDAFNSFPKPPFPSVIMTTHQIPGPKDAPEVTVRIFRPKKQKGKLPGVLWMHGGGYILGFAEQTDLWCQLIVDKIGVVAVSVEYRLAPEHPYPAGLEDCYASLTWLKDVAEELQIDTERIAIGGDSAGGGLCAALSMLARDRNGPKICFQMPLYPMLEDRCVTESCLEIQDPKVWNCQKNKDAWKMYHKNLIHEREIPIYAAPGRATPADLVNLPPTYTYIGDLDAFKDEVFEYVKKLSHAGVSVEFHLYPGCFHGFEAQTLTTDFTKKVIERSILALKNAVTSSSSQ